MVFVAACEMRAMYGRTFLSGFIVWMGGAQGGVEEEKAVPLGNLVRFL